MKLSWETNNGQNVYRPESKYNYGVNYKLHYVTAREAYNIVKAAEAGKAGNPGEYRDFVIPNSLDYGK